VAIIKKYSVEAPYVGSCKPLKLALSENPADITLSGVYDIFIGLAPLI
jgi:hypothetical protein